MIGDDDVYVVSGVGNVIFYEFQGGEYDREVDLHEHVEAYKFNTPAEKAAFLLGMKAGRNCVAYFHRWVEAFDFVKAELEKERATNTKLEAVRKEKAARKKMKAAEGA